MAAGEEGVERVYAIAEAIMNRYTSPNIQKIGLTCLAGCIDAHPAMCKSYVQCLFNLPHHFRMNLLGPVEEVEPVQILGATASNYEIDSLPARWNGYKVAQAAVELIFEAKLPNLEKEVRRALSPLFFSAFRMLTPVVPCAQCSTLRCLLRRRPAQQGARPRMWRHGASSLSA